MTSGQQLEVLRIQLSQVHRELVQLVTRAGVAPGASVSSMKYDGYVKTLDRVEGQLDRMNKMFAHLRGQGPAFYGRNDDPYKAKQRAQSFQQHVDSVEGLLGACFDLLSTLLAPDSRFVVKNLSDLGKKADEFLKMLHQTPHLHTSIGHDAVIGLPPPSVSVGAEPSIAVMLNVLLIAVRMLRKRSRLAARLPARDGPTAVHDEDLRGQRLIAEPLGLHHDGPR